MKKSILFGVCMLSLCAVAFPALAAEPVKFTVDEAEKDRINAQIALYHKEAKDEIAKAEADIKAAQDQFDRTKAKSEKTINDANTQIKKLRADAEQAKDEFERARTDANTKIENANARIKKANEDLERNIKSLAGVASKTDNTKDKKKK